ncbi:MAG: lysis system i-spanin subunit Rz [Pseudomonas veronii]|uniref:lysis system i-spanin subunit Rz n=1 Tax=Pseudomonas veronii TaxID=76761 RepID=UPI003C76C998
MLREILFPLLVCLLAYIGFDILQEQRDTAREERDAAQSEVNGLREAARINGEMLAARDQSDQKNTEELNHALAQNDALRRDVDDGRQRLRIRATCRTAVPTTTGTTGVADAGTAELAADARPDYFTLRDQLALSRQMILGLQDYTRQVCQRMPANP